MRAPHAQAARHGIGGVAGLRHSIDDFAARGISDLAGLVESTANSGNGYAGDEGYILNRCRLRRAQSFLTPADSRRTFQGFRLVADIAANLNCFLSM